MEPMLVNKQELADLFDVSVPTVDTWIKDGCPVEREGSAGRAYQFDVEKVTEWRRDVEERARLERAERDRKLAQMQFQLTGGAADEAGGAGLTGRQRIDAIQAALLEDKLRRERRHVIPREEVRSDYEAVFQLLRQRLTSVHVVMMRTVGLSPEQASALQREMSALLVDLRQQVADPELRPELAHAD